MAKDLTKPEPPNPSDSLLLLLELERLAHPQANPTGPNP